MTTLKGTNSIHIGFFTKNAAEVKSKLNYKICFQVSSELDSVKIKHRQKPKIFQFNSIDIDGVEIVLP